MRPSQTSRGDDDHVPKSYLRGPPRPRACCRYKDTPTSLMWGHTSTLPRQDRAMTMSSRHSPIPASPPEKTFSATIHHVRRRWNLLQLNEGWEPLLLSRLALHVTLNEGVYFYAFTLLYLPTNTISAHLNVLVGINIVVLQFLHIFHTMHERCMESLKVIFIPSLQLIT
jgi:hypothetical protein